MIEGMLTLFCQIWAKSLTDDLIQAYTKALRNYTDLEVQKAGHACMDSLERFPKPIEIIQRIERREEESSRFRLETHKCSDCGAVKLAIEEPIGCQHWQCRTCYTGLTNQQIAERFAQLAIIGKRAPAPVIDETERFNTLADQAREIIEGDYEDG